MQLSIKATGENVRVLSFLLAKNPQNLYERKQNGHLVRLFYNTFEKNEVEATIFVTPDPIELVKNSSERYDITSYINDREFAISSIFCSLTRSALGTALNGKPKEEYSKWVSHCFNLEFSFGPIASDLSDQQIIDLFAPIGYNVSISKGDTNYQFDFKTVSSARFVQIEKKTTLHMGLRQLFVLIPVLDNYKHYYIDEKEIEKIERYGEGWLDLHPQRNFILKRSLRFKEVIRLVEDIQPNESRKSKGLNDWRYETIIDHIKKLTKHESIIDFGSGEGNLSLKLGFLKGVREILAVEPSLSSATKARKRFEEASEEKGFLYPIPIISSLFYFDRRLKNKDIVILCEVIEHIDSSRLPRVMDMLLHQYQPNSLIITTPNREYNQVYQLEDEYRHGDHRFEWTREEFKKRCHTYNQHSKYDLFFYEIGESHERFGAPTQMCTFIRKEK
ncbi:methyltransferase domain-containing protein [Bacillus carboniphilus]|uniref:Small RNA 2'-O-methyltransferase n=1 Tax=Bacillus carboniphilus TaxID=86663 RepID=A0ABY9JQY4_9BACI|nr:methyltransferase domain-containing protein [Bacillus carboniphilus]WLR41219.1 methyltransferase domain-containing protein [Bacillus carboniphilus]